MHRADLPIVHAIQGDSKEVDRRETAVAVFEPGITYGGAPARVGCLCTYSRGARRESCWSRRVCIH